jgi:hypothetical protein
MQVSLKESVPNLICLTIDVEWANPEVFADIVQLLDDRGLRATFFCTHSGINVSGHERALHPNFRRRGDTLRWLQDSTGSALGQWTDTEIYQYVVESTHIFCPEAVGVRAHSLFYDSELLPIYRQKGLEYDSTYFLPMKFGLNPVWKENDILEIPIYYSDHFDLIEQVSGFRLEGLKLDQPGMKVFDFHPNMVFINASTNAQYLDSKPYYRDYDRLLKLRYPGRGVRTLFLELLNFIATQQLPTGTLAEVNAAWRITREG